MNKKVLGKGLGAIISKSFTQVEDFERGIAENAGRILELDVSSILPNPSQPRSHFNEAEIMGLAESIKSVGLLQPIIVRKAEGGYTVVAGERRLRAFKHAGMARIRAIVIDAGEEENLTLALIENIQRENLDPIEEARAYRVLSERFSMKQQDIAKKVGKDRATIANSIRLLGLPEDIQEGLSAGKISAGHAKVLLSVQDETRQRELYGEIVEKGMSVRSLEAAAEGQVRRKSAAKKKKKAKEAHIREVEEKLVRALGTKVEIRHAAGKGKIEISFYSLDDFDRIIEFFEK